MDQAMMMEEEVEEAEAEEETKAEEEIKVEEEAEPKEEYARLIQISTGSVASQNIVLTETKERAGGPKRIVQVAKYADIPDIQELIDYDVWPMYNTKNVQSMIHRCAYSFILRVDDKAVAALFMRNYPNVPSVPCDDWVSWVKKLYGLRDLNSQNTFWVHMYLFYDAPSAAQSLKTMLEHIFDSCNKKKYVIFVVPPLCHYRMSWMADLATIILPIDYTDPEKIQTLRLLTKQNFTIAYKIRRAVEEDNDDLVPLIDFYNVRPKQNYGDYYIAEIITGNDKKRHLIVAEYKGTAVSVLCLNEEVNYEDLNRSFRLAAFTGLFKPKTYECEVQEHEYTTPCVPDVPSTINIPLREEIYQSSTDSSVVTFNSDDERCFVLKTIDELSLGDFSFALKVLSELNVDETVPSNITGGSAESRESKINNNRSALLVSNESSVWTTKGTPNAFAIEVAAALPGHEASLCQLLEASFECFKTKDYCIMSLPSSERYFPFLRSFVRVTPRSARCHPHELYIANKVSFNPISVREAYPEDLPVVKKFCSYMLAPGNLQSRFEESLDAKNALRTYFLINGAQKDDPIGMVVISDECDLEYIKKHYALGWWIDITQDKMEDVGVIYNFSLSPLFRRHLGFFLREVHRMSSHNLLLYGLNQYDQSPFRARTLATVLPELLPVPPRKLILNDKDHKHYSTEPFALYISSPRLTQIPKCEINQKIVVIGSSNIAISFLRSLLFSEGNDKVAIFNNVTLITKQGLTYTIKPHKIVDLMRVHSTTTDYYYQHRLNLRCYINIVYGELTAIDRKDKMITVNDTQIFGYDMLFIMCGLQHEVPIKPKIKDYLSSALPMNMFLVNTSFDALKALHKMVQVHNCDVNRKYNIVVYGAIIKMYCCVAALLEFGYHPDYIILVETEKAPLFPDGDVYEAVINNIKQLGIIMYSEFTLIDWTVPSGFHTVTLTFESLTRQLEIEALFVFLYPPKSVNVKAYKAIINSGLVFDGRLVITPDCKTNDPNIYAAGTVTKYPRRYYADRLTQEYFNQGEVGKCLARKIRAMLLPYEEVVTPKYGISDKHSTQDVKYPVPIYQKPLMTHCTLPGGLHYLHVCRPGYPVPLESAMADDDYGSVLVTGSCTNLANQGYFRLHLNSLNVVETITCLSLQPFNHKKLVRLWGKHEASLNNLVKRFEVAKIRDLYRYFESSWCTAIFHDEYHLYLNDLMRVMISRAEDSESPIEDIVRYLSKKMFKKIKAPCKRMMENRFTDSGFEDELKFKLLEFIGRNLDTLDMYAHPSVAAGILKGYRDK